MTLLLRAQSISKSFGTQTLFENISFSIFQGDRIGLLGPNGSGKTTLLKTIMDIESVDQGSISKTKNLRIAYASQSPEFPSLPLEEILIKDIGSLSDVDLRTRARILLGKFLFQDYTQNASTLSGGWKKRLDIARALMHEPDLLILDEPTNHLDLEGILWLEKFLKKENITYLIVSHDRYFLENVSNKIIELNKCYPEGILVANGTLSDFMEQKKFFLEAQAQRQKGLASTVRQEVEWLKKNPKARTTKSQSRINNAYNLIDELSSIKQRNTVSTVDINFSATDRETKKLLVAHNLKKSWENKTVFEKVDLMLSPGTRLGIVGKNGTGKTTLLKILAGLIEQDLGTIKYAEGLQMVYFDQHREQIDPEISLRRALSPLGDMVDFRGKSIHVNGWAQKFLFSPDRLELPVKCLSGGERARILIARLMLQPADILFLDEPTNDLDIQTLEVIEESLSQFAGAVVIISHDRCLMDRICTQILGLDSIGKQEFYADYSQWETANQNQIEIKKSTTVKEVKKIQDTKPLSKKLSYKEQQELNGMEQSILETENRILKIQKNLEDPAIVQNNIESLRLYHELAEAEQALEKLFSRWEELS